MKGGTRAGLALAAGYVLGRRHKLRMAALLAAAVASGRLSALGGAALKRGAMTGSGGLLGKMTPQVGGIAEKVRGELVSAGKAAAMAAASNRIDTISDSIHQRADAIRGPGHSQADDDDIQGGGQRDAQDSGPDDRHHPEDNDPGDARGQYADDEYEDDADDDEYEDPDDEYEDDADDLDEPQSSGSRRPRGRSRSPVSRTGR